MMGKKVIRVLAIVLVVVLLAAGALYMRRFDQRDNDRMQALYAEVEPLQRERETLVAQRNQMDSDYALLMRDPATVEILFRELSEDLFSEAYPVMRDHGIVGTVGLSISQFPTRHKQISLEQFNHLIKDGWGTCLVFEPDYTLSSWLNQMEDQVDRLGIARPTAIYFPDNSYNEAMLDVLREHEIHTIILPGETGRVVSVTDLKGEFWFTVAMPWNYTGVNADTDLLSHTDGANLTYTVSFTSLWDAFDKASFTSMLDSWNDKLEMVDPIEAANQSGGLYSETETTEQKLQKPLIKPTTFDNAKLLHLQAQDTENAQVAEIIAKQQELDARIAALDEEIRAIYDRWQIDS